MQILYEDVYESDDEDSLELQSDDEGTDPDILPPDENKSEDVEERGVNSIRKLNVQMNCECQVREREQGTLLNCSSKKTEENNYPNHLT